MRNYSFPSFAGFRPLIVFAGIVLASLASSALGGTIRHDVSDQLYRDLAAEPQFQAVGTYSGRLFGSLTLIHPQWALTAAHVVDSDFDGNIGEESFGTVRIAGNTRTATQLIVPTGINGNPGWTGGIGQGFDIALVRLSSPILGVTPASLYTSFQELGQTITMVGFGQTGNGLTGASGGTGTKRAGQNVVDELFSTGFANGATGLRWDFDDPPPGTSATNRLGGSNTALPLEYQIAPGDSGGGSFIFENGNWFLAGVHSGTYDFQAPFEDSHTYGDVGLVTRVAAYQQFIFSSIPELAVLVPEPGSLAALALVGLMAMRRQRSA